MFCLLRHFLFGRSRRQVTVSVCTQPGWTQKYQGHLTITLKSKVKVRFLFFGTPFYHIKSHTNKSPLYIYWFVFKTLGKQAN